MTKHKRLDSGLIVPVVEQKDMPRFSTRMFRCTHESDVTNFKELVEKKRGNYCGMITCDFLNYKNQPVGLIGEYICIYQFHEDITMEVLC